MKIYIDSFPFIFIGELLSLVHHPGFSFFLIFLLDFNKRWQKWKAKRRGQWRHVGWYDNISENDRCSSISITELKTLNKHWRIERHWCIKELRKLNQTTVPENKNSIRKVYSHLMLGITMKERQKKNILRLRICFRISIRLYIALVRLKNTIKVSKVFSMCHFFSVFFPVHFIFSFYSFRYFSFLSFFLIDIRVLKSQYLQDES